MNEILYVEKRNPQDIIINHSMMAFFASSIPFHFASGVAVKTVQLKMIYELTRMYRLKFSKNLTKSILLILGAGLAFSGIVGVAKWALPKMSIGLFSPMSVSIALGSSAATYAIGNIMYKHFESGGNLENLDLKKSRQHLSELYEEGKMQTKNMINNNSKISFPHPTPQQ